MSIAWSGFFAFLFFPVLAQDHQRSPFVEVPAAASDTLRFRTQLGSFEATDLHGRTWRSVDLRGKVTVVDIWATFCLPCRQEHPEIQRFYEVTKDSNDVQVLTFSLDHDPRQVESYMKENKYTFPVIVDGNLVEKLFSSEGGLPKAWVIDRTGRRSDPFRSWPLGRILLEAQRFASAKPN